MISFRHFGKRASFFGAALLLLPAVALVSAGAQQLAPTSSANEHIASGIHLLQQGDAAAARVQFSAAIAADPRSADALTWRGIAENQLSRYREAGADFEAALKIQPGSVSAEYNLALSSIRTGDSDRAIEMLRKVLAAQPGSFEPEYNLALLLEQKHDTTGAIDHLRAADRAHPGDSAVLQHLSLDLVAAGRTKEAAEVLSRSDAPAPDALRKVSYALLEAGDSQSALPLLERLRADQPGAEADLMLARACIGAHEDARALALLRPYTSSDRAGDASYLAGLADDDMGARQDAFAAFQRAVQVDPRNTRALFHLGQLESSAPATLADAAHHLQQAVQLEPSNIDYVLALGRVLLEQNDAAQAASVLRTAQADGRRAAQRDLLLGITDIILKGAYQAMPTLQRALDEDSSVALTHDMLGFCYFSQGAMARAAALYARASDLSPATVLFARNAAIAFEHAGDTEQAVTYARRATAAPNAAAVDHEILGRLLARAGQLQEGIRELTAAITIDPNLEPAYFLLGRTYMQSGDRAQAKVWLDRLQQLKTRDQKRTTGADASKVAISGATLLQGGPITTEPAP